MTSSSPGARRCSTGSMWGSTTTVLCTWTTSCLAAALIAMVMVVPTAAAVDEAQATFVGQLQATAIHGKGYLEHMPGNGSAAHDHDHFEQYHLRLKSGEIRHLSFPKTPSYMPRAGTYILVQTRPYQDCGLTAENATTLCVGKMMAREDAPKDVFSAGQPRGKIQIRALVMQLQVCGQGPATTPEKLAGALYEGLPNSQAETLQGMFKACSYSTAEFSQQIGGMIIPVTVPIPCQGRTPWNAPFDSSTCPFTEWSDVANQYVKNELGYNWEDFKYKIYVVPPGDLCSWGGMGWVGCKTDCRAWISGDLWEYPATWMHELGHNLYLNHAGSFQTTNGVTQFVDYKDDSGAMGHCCDTRCFNAPHSFQLGWSKPLGVMHQENLPAGEWHSFTLPPRVGDASKDVNLLRVYGDWSGPAAAYNLYLEYRKAQSYDIGLQETVRDKVTLYSTPVGDAMPFTTFEAAIGENQILHESRVGSKLAIWVGGTAAGGIRVHLCRPASDTEQDCGNGKDDDCDGFTDMEDPDCHPSTRRMLGLTQRPNSGKQQLPPQNSEELQQPSRGNVAYN